MTPDGATLTLKHDRSSLEEPWFTQCSIRFSGSSAASTAGGRAFETGPVGTADGHVAILLDGKYVAEYAGPGGGTYLLAQNADRSVGLVAWQGRWHEVYCWVNEPDPSHALMLENLAGLTFTDGPAGVRVELPAGQAYQQITATKHVPGIGFLELTQTATTASILPKWSGHKVRAGEIWRQVTQDSDLEPVRTLVCASPSTIVTLHSRGGTEDEGLAFLSGASSMTWQ